MSELAIQTAELIGMLPDDEITILNALVKKLIAAWDPDFTKVTSVEKERIEEAEEEIKNGIFYTSAEVFG